MRRRGTLLVMLLLTACSTPHARTPGYVLLNDTAGTVSVSGCGAPCPTKALQPNAKLAFALGQGEVVVTRADGSKACFHLVSGVAVDRALPSTALKVTGGARC